MNSFNLDRLSIITSIVIFLVYLLIAVLLKKTCLKIVTRLPVSRQKIPLFFTYSTQIVILLTGSMTALEKIGLNLMGVMTAFGITGLIVGIALKDIISSIVAGVIIVFDNSIKIGDILIFKEIKGKVLKIDIRSVVLYDEEKYIKHFICNSRLLSEYFSIKDMKKSKKQ